MASAPSQLHGEGVLARSRGCAGEIQGGSLVRLLCFDAGWQSSRDDRPFVGRASPTALDDRRIVGMDRAIGQTGRGYAAECHALRGKYDEREEE